jgi:Kelch motif.
MVTARANGRAVRLGVTKDIMVIGGFNAANKSLAISEIYRFNDTINQPQFTQTEQMKYKRKDCMAVYINNTIYVFGGTDESNKVIFDIEKYKPTISTAATEKNIVTNYQLNQNYPNPFNPSTTIRYSVANNTKVTLEVYDILGRRVAELVDKNQPAGLYEVQFNGSRLASGVYMVYFKAGNYTKAHKIMLLK